MHGQTGVSKGKWVELPLLANTKSFADKQVSPLSVSYTHLTLPTT